MLTGRHWLAGDAPTGQLALLGFLPRRWSYVRDLYSRRTGRAIQKAYELLCWWRLSDRVHRRRALAQELRDALGRLGLRCTEETLSKLMDGRTRLGQRSRAKLPWTVGPPGR